MERHFYGSQWHDKQIVRHVPELAYRPERDFAAWRTQVREKIAFLLGDMPDYADFRFDVEYDRLDERFREVRFIVTVEDDAFPCILTIPPGASETNPAPLLVCMQGHGTGMHLSLGRVENEGDVKLLGDHMDFAVQAVSRGFAALLVEMRFMGERRFDESEGKDVISCYRPAMGALLAGKTVIGLRVADLRAAISTLPYFRSMGVATDRLVCLGHSGGGTAAFFAACLDERLDAAVISCALCNFEYSILRTEHCSCNYVPGLFKYLDMSDMAAAVFPRPIVSLGGARDEDFPIEGVEKTLESIEGMYAANGFPGRCRLARGEGGHAFYSDAAWREIERLYA